MGPSARDTRCKRIGVRACRYRDFCSLFPHRNVVTCCHPHGGANLSADAGAYCRSSSNREPYTGACANGDSRAHGHTHLHAGSSADCYTETQSDTYSESAINAQADGYAHSGRHVYANAFPDANLHPKANPNPCSNPNTGADSHADTSTICAEHLGFYGRRWDSIPVYLR